MKFHLRRRPLALAVTTLAILVGLAVVADMAGAAGVQDTGPCPASWFPLSHQPPAIQQQCIRNRIQSDANDLATAEARPKTNASPPTPDPRFPAHPLGQIPSSATLIQPDDQGLQGIEGLPDPITSVWDDGYVPSPNHLGYALIRVYAVGPHALDSPFPDTPDPQIARLYWPEGDMVDLHAQYDSSWTCPQAVGSLTITNITGPAGVVSFTSTSGVSGTLDMATGAWTFSQ
jgi:hypothetical protein